MPSAAARRARSAALRRAASAARRRDAARRRSSSAMLLTATLCLLAGGAVMVYSASSATSLLQGGGTGSGLARSASSCYGAARPRRDARRSRARRSTRCARLTGAAAGRLVRARARRAPAAASASRVNGAQRWLGVGPLQFQPSELMKLALVLYAAHVFSPRRPQRVHALRERAQAAAARRRRRRLPARRHPARPRHGAGDRVRARRDARSRPAMPMRAGSRSPARVRRGRRLLRARRALRAARLTSFLDPWAHASTSGFQAVQGQIAIGSGGLFGGGPGAVGAEDLLPAGGADGLHPRGRSARSSASSAICALLFLYGLIAVRGPARGEAARSLHSALIAVGVTSLIVCQATAERVRRARHRAADGRAAAVRLLRLEQPARDARRRWGCCSTSPRGGTAHVRAVPSRAGARRRATARSGTIGR